MFTGTLERAILETLAYSDVFEYPLRLDEIHRYLPVYIDRQELLAALPLMMGQMGEMDGFYFISDHSGIVDVRKRREIRSQKLMQHALRYGRVLGSLPFIRMVALTGSLAVMNVSKNADFDYMLVAVPGRVWTARAFALLFNRFTRPFGHTLCPNLIVAETALEWPLHDLYSARELYQMIPITGFDVYQKLLKANEWAKEFLPNATTLSLRGERSSTKQSPPPKRELLRRPFQSLFTVAEWALHGKVGDRFERWEMKRKIARFSRQAGFGEETAFTADVCQGNFHHHRKWTKEAFEERLRVIANHEVVKRSPAQMEIASSPIGSSQ